MTKPVRIQLGRRKGFNLQAVSLALNGLPAVKVTRPGKFGNPLRAGMWRGYKVSDAVEDFRRWHDREPGVRTFDHTFGEPPDVSPLRGKNLACWCKPGEPCHADVLLEIANSQPPGEKT